MIQVDSTSFNKMAQPKLQCKKPPNGKQQRLFKFGGFQNEWFVLVEAS
jgi:hypothetical protein